LFKILADINLVPMSFYLKYCFPLAMDEKMITIIDYGMGNLGSVLNMLKKIGTPAKIEGEPKEILKADKLLLPGVGSFDAAMKRIEDQVCMKC